METYKIVAAVDVSPEADAVLACSFDEAGRRTQAEVHLVTISAKDEPATLQMLHRHLEDVARARLAALGRAGGQTRVRLHVRAGDAGDEIVNLVLEVEADLVVLGGRVIDGWRRHLSKVANQVITNVPCPAMLARQVDYGAHPLRDQQCPACVAVRAESSGERWFCEQHSGRGSLTTTMLMPHSEPGLHGGPML